MTGRGVAACHILVIGAEFVCMAVQAGGTGRVGGVPYLVHGLEVTLIPLEVVRAEVIMAGGAASRRLAPLEFSHSVVAVDAFVGFMAGMVEFHGQILVAVPLDMVYFQSVIRRIKLHGFRITGLDPKTQP